MKSFILAATSIVGIISIANITDAKVKRSNNKIDPQQNCLNQNITSSRQSKSLQSTVISNEDIRGICQAIQEDYRKLNNSTDNLPIADSSFTPFKDFIEVEKISLTIFEVNADEKYTRVDLVEKIRHYRSKSMKETYNKNLQANSPVPIDSYNWEPNPSKEKITVKTRWICVSKSKGKWSVNPSKCPINAKKQ
jgi:hypothetical protein